METYVPMIGVGFPYNKNFSTSRKKEIQKMTIEDLLKKTIYPTVVVPEGRDDDVGYAITVVDDLILIPLKNMP